MYVSVLVYMMCVCVVCVCVCVCTHVVCVEGEGAGDNDSIPTSPSILHTICTGTGRNGGDVCESAQPCSCHDGVPEHPPSARSCLLPSALSSAGWALSYTGEGQGSAGPTDCRRGTDSTWESGTYASLMCCASILG